MELPKGAAWGRDPRAREAGSEFLESLGKRKRETCLRLRPGRMTSGQLAEVATRIGWPGTTDRYRVDVRVPPGISGSATLQIEAAWIPGGLTIIPVER